MISVLTITVVYAALSTTLNINGNAEVSAASWDIYLDNVILNNQSATTDVPKIVDKKTATFSTSLTKPGDFYEFTIDVVNNGTIDAMIESVEKTPEFTEGQAKYLNYIVEYQNGESISTKQLVSKQSFVRLKVKVEFRKDLTASDLPTTSETLDFSFKVNYVQSDESGTNVKDDGLKKSLEVISGDLNTVGSEVALGDEHFYIISNTNGKITMLAKYNLYAGGSYSSSTRVWTPYGDEATGIQDATMTGFVSGQTVKNGTLAFSSTDYWSNSEDYSSYVYDSNSSLYNYVENYKLYLENLGFTIEDARLIYYDELIGLGCSGSSCKSAPSWVYSSSYWSGDVSSYSSIWRVSTSGTFSGLTYSYNDNCGVRVVIVMSV